MNFPMFRTLINPLKCSFQTRGFKFFGQKIVKVLEKPPALRNGESLMSYVKSQQLKKLDPSGTKSALVNKHNHSKLRAGDIVRIIYQNRQPPITAMIIGIKRNGADSNILMRNNVSKTGVEFRISIFNPIVERIDILRRPVRYRRRNKLYYIRGNQLDVGDLENDMRSKIKI